MFAWLCVHEWCVYVRTQAGSGSPTMAAAIQDFQRSESDRLNEVKGHLEIALLEKHFLRKSPRKLAHTNIHQQSTLLDTSCSFWTGIHARHCTSNLLCCWVYRPNVCWQLIGSCWWKSVQAGFAFPQAAVSTTERFPVPRIPLVSSQRKALKLCHG